MMYYVQISVAPTHGPGTYRMLPGDRLYPNDYLISQNGLWKLKYQTDGNLVLYNADESQSYWESGTWNTGQAAGYLSLQPEGNLFMVGNPDIGAYWAVGNNMGATFRLQDDRNLILADANNGLVWSPNTYVRRLTKEGDETMPARELVLATPEEIEAALEAQTMSATLDASAPQEQEDHRQLQAGQTYGSFIGIQSVQVWRMPRVASTVTTTTSCGTTYEAVKK